MTLFSSASWVSTRTAIPTPLVALALLSVTAGCPDSTDTSVSETAAMTNVTTESGGSGATQTGETSPTGPTGETTGSETGVVDVDPKKVDLLFVIDNSGSMAPVQDQVNGDVEALVDPLIADGLSLRIGITTTDMGNPQCSADSTKPAMGNLVLSSCIDRVEAGDFTFEGVDPPIDASTVCTDFCGFDDSGFQVTPTATDVDPDPVPRPWIEVDGGDSNLGEQSVIGALRCFLPQGVAGCGFESPLEAMYSVIVGSETPDDPNYGFIRGDARLIIVMITDETDCSLDPDWKDIFQTNKVFWNHPMDPKPVSAVCWRAGVTCTGSPAEFDDCVADNHDINGSSGVSDSSAVLYPLSRYTEQLTALKGDTESVELHLIAGVPAGYSTGTPITYSEDAPDPDFVDSFGIGPGCVSATSGPEVPPVREREVAETLAGGARPVYSVCASSYVPAFTAIAESILAQ